MRIKYSIYEYKFNNINTHYQLLKLRIGELNNFNIIDDVIKNNKNIYNDLIDKYKINHKI